MKSVIRSCLIGLCVAGLSACASVPPLKHVLLSPPQTGQSPARPSGWQVSRVQVPEYLDNYDIELRSNAFVLSRLPNAKWAERLPVAMTRLLQQTIDEKLQASRNRPYKVDVIVDTFEPQPSGQVVLAARWTVTNTRTHHVVAQDNALIKKPLPVAARDADSIGRTMSAAVRELAYRILAAAG